MAITSVLANMPTVTDDVAVTRFDVSNLSTPVLEVKIEKGVRREIATYKLLGGISGAKTTIEVIKAIFSSGSMSESIRLRTVEILSDGTEEISRLPIDVYIAVNATGAEHTDVTKVLAMIGAAYSLWYRTIHATTNVPQNEVMNALNSDSPADTLA